MLSLLCGGLAADLQQLLSLIPANQKQEHQLLSSTRGSQDIHVLVSIAAGSRALR